MWYSMVWYGMVWYGMVWYDKFLGMFVCRMIRLGAMVDSLLELAIVAIGVSIAEEKEEKEREN